MIRTVVVKVGTSTLTNREGELDTAFLPVLAAQLCGLLDEGRRVVLVSSGAVRAGVQALGWRQRPRAVGLKQAAAAVGQGRLMAHYQEAFGARDRIVGQVLLTRQLAQDRATYVNAQTTLTTLLRHKVVPVVNENDTVAIEELQFGDNDTLAALVASLVSADLLVLLTDVEGLWDAERRIIPYVGQITDELRALAGGAGKHGSGGMATKLAAAEIAGAAGVTTVIARGHRVGVLREVVEAAESGSHSVGTTFAPRERKLQGRKHWLAYGARPNGSITVNACARRVLIQDHRSLLPTGIIGVQGPFSPGETVRVLDETGMEFARGQVTCDWRDVDRLRGLHTADISEVLGHNRVEEIVHRDNLVILAE